MKDKFKRIIATGLLAAMISSFTACNTNAIITDTEGNIVGVDPGELAPPEKTNPYAELEGSIWDVVGKSGALIGDYKSSNEILDQGIPTTFLEQEGLIRKREDGIYVIANGGKQPDDSYNPFHYYAYIDPNSKNNDIYLLVQYASDHLGDNSQNPDIWVATYMLEYELDDKNYETFLKLDGDRTIKNFIQEMDKQFEPKLIFKSVTAQDIISNGSYLNKEHWTKKGFPNIFIANVDYDNKIITYGAKSKEGIRYYDLVPSQSKVWTWAQEEGLTEEECEEKIYMPTINTPVGQCITKFQLRGWSIGYTIEQSTKAYNTTNRVQELELIDINSQEKTLTNSR